MAPEQENLDYEKEHHQVPTAQAEKQESHCLGLCRLGHQKACYPARGLNERGGFNFLPEDSAAALHGTQHQVGDHRLQQPQSAAQPGCQIAYRGARLRAHLPTYCPELYCIEVLWSGLIVNSSQESLPRSKMR